MTLEHEKHIFATIQVCTIHFSERYNERYKKPFQNYLFSQQQKTYPISLSLF